VCVQARVVVLMAVVTMGRSRFGRRLRACACVVVCEVRLKRLQLVDPLLQRADLIICECMHVLSQ
jgi:hypothetical protein